MGLSLVRDVFDLEGTRQFTERAVDMKIKAQMDPAMIYDNNVINPGTAEEFDPYLMRARLGVDGDVDKVLKTAIPAELLKIGTEPFEWLKYIAEAQDEQLGVRAVEGARTGKGRRRWRLGGLAEDSRPHRSGYIRVNGSRRWPTCWRWSSIKSSSSSIRPAS